MGKEPCVETRRGARHEGSLSCRRIPGLQAGEMSTPPSPLDKLIVGIILGFAAFPVIWGFSWALVRFFSS